MLLCSVHQRFFRAEIAHITAEKDSLQFGLFTDSEKLRIAIQLERIEEGVRKWRNATRSPKSQEQLEVAGTQPEEPAVSMY